MSYSSMIVLVSPNDNIAMGCSQSECDLHSMLLGGFLLLPKLISYSLKY